MDRDEIEREAKERLDESGAFRRLGELISQIGEAMLESVEAARDAINAPDPKRVPAQVRRTK